jgi:hypothetical protein
MPNKALTETVDAAPFERAVIAPRAVKVDPIVAAGRERKLLSVACCFRNMVRLS